MKFKCYYEDMEDNVSTMEAADVVVKRIDTKARACKAKLRVIASIKSGEAIRQGDIYLVALDKVPAVRGKLTKSAQLAVGQTQGSRHIIDPVPAGMKIYGQPAGSSVLVGPIVSSPERFRLTHPEHGHFSMPAGAYQVLYQRDYTKERAEELRRVQD